MTQSVRVSVAFLFIAACGGSDGGGGNPQPGPDGAAALGDGAVVSANDGGSGGLEDAASDLALPEGAPRVLYTDLVSGPNTGGENNKGVYLSIFGVNFGGSGLGSTVKVYVNGAEVDNYRTLAPSKGRADIQQITVQLGAIGNPTPGTPLPIEVRVNGVGSNTDHTFTVNPGRIFFFDPATGDDNTGKPDDITKPYKTVQSADISKGAWGLVKPGDVLCLRGGTYTTVGREQYFMRFIIGTSGGYGSGKAPTGAVGTGPITLMGYPGEDAFIDGNSATHPAGAIAGVNGETYPDAGKWAVVANLRIEGGGYDGPISQEIHGDNWRVVNNELSAKTGVTTGGSPSRMAGITGNGGNAFWYGNHIHDIQGSAQECHGIYIDGDGSYDIAYNEIHDIKSGNGLQLYSNGGNGSDFINNVSFHHNHIANVTKHLINIADGCKDNIVIWNNVASGAAVAAIRFNAPDLKGAKIVNNTFVESSINGNGNYGALMNDAGFGAQAVDIENNIFVAHAGTPYNSGSVEMSSGDGTIKNNLWFGGTGSVSFDTAPKQANPMFVSASDFHLQPASPAVDAASVVATVGDDFTVTTSRPQGAAPDIGAYELSK